MKNTNTSRKLIIVFFAKIRNNSGTFKEKIYLN